MIKKKIEFFYFIFELRAHLYLLLSGSRRRPPPFLSFHIFAANIFECLVSMKKIIETTTISFYYLSI